MNASNMSAYAAQINLKLLNDIIIFVENTAKANYAQNEELSNRCIFPLTSSSSAADAMQRDYGFLYLGELLERYEERFGMTLPDRRAIALALGYTKDIVSPEMFVGTQRTDFIQSVLRYAENDVYLTGALYLLHVGQSSVLAYEDKLNEWTYTLTEELIFAMSLFSDPEQAFSQFSGQLISLLGKGRTLPVYGNTDIFNSVLVMLFPLKKRMKARQMNLLRALLSLPISFVKEDSKHYAWLLENGYTPIEISYANAAALCSQCIPNGPGCKSITAEKLIVALFRIVLSHDKPLPGEVYSQLTQLYQMYSTFDIKCCGEYQLADTLRDNLCIQVPETMAWFIRCCGDTLHPATRGYDIMESKWDSLANNLSKEQYQRLFEGCLTKEMDAAQIQKRLDRYHTLTEKNYTDRYSESTSNGKFDLLVNAGVIDLWTAFQSCLTKDGSISDDTLLYHISNYCRNITTVQAFEFLKQFLPRYGYSGMKSYLNKYFSGFKRELWEEKSYNSTVTLNLQRDFLTDIPEEQRILLHWLDEYFFTMNPEKYLNFVLAVLKDEQVAALLSSEDQRGIFDALISNPKLSTYDADQLKRCYLTPEEQQAEQKAREAAKAARKQQEHLKMVQDIESSYADTNIGTFEQVIKFLKKYFYPAETVAAAHHVVCNGLEQILQNKGYTLSPEEANHFLDVCGNLIQGGTLGWTEFQSHISKIKEVRHDDSDGVPDK